MNARLETGERPLPPSTPTFAMLRTLAGVATLSGLLVVLAYKLTLPRIEQNQREAIERAVFQVVPGAAAQVELRVLDGRLLAAGAAGGESVYAAYDAGGRLVGLAIQAAQQGYQDVIRLLFGFDPACSCIRGIKVLKMAETPGLGDKIITDPGFLANFQALDASLDRAGQTLAHPIAAVKHGSKQQPWQVDAISGATISSNAVAKALDKSARRLVPVIMDQLPRLQAAAPAPREGD